MLVGGNKNTIDIDWLESKQCQLDSIKAYLQGAVYCWCKNCKENGENKWFSAKDLVGGENYFWQGTPLIVLYNHYADEDETNAEAKAAMDLGMILKMILKEDKRTFVIQDVTPKRYLWTGNEINQ